MTTHVEATVETRSQSRATFLLSTGGKLTVPSAVLSDSLQPGAKAVIAITPEQESSLEKEAMARQTLNELLSRGEA